MQDAKPKQVIALKGCVLTPGKTDKLKSVFGFELFAPSASFKLTLRAHDADDLRDWMAALQRAVATTPATGHQDDIKSLLQSGSRTKRGGKRACRICAQW